MSLTTPEVIRTLQRKLYTKAKQEPAYRFYALYDKVWRADILMFAYRLVRANKGSPGVDWVGFEDIEQQTGIDKFLSELAQDLKDKTYHCSGQGSLIKNRVTNSRQSVISDIFSTEHLKWKSPPKYSSIFFALSPITG